MSTLFGGGNKTAQAQQQTVYTGIQLQTSTYGPVVPIVYGQTRVAGNIIWYGGFASHQVNNGSSSGSGKGGSLSSGNGAGASYTYSASFAMGICEGPVESILSVWVDPTSVSLASLGLTPLNGTYPQSPWGYLETYDPPAALAYPGIAYVVAENYNLGSSPNLPNFNFEVAGLLWNSFPGGDANPASVFYDFLTNVNYGVLFPLAKMGSLTVYSDYCLALGIGISPAFDSQQDAASAWKDILSATNSEAVWSEGVLSIVPYGDQTISGNGATYTAPSAPLYALDDDDFLVASAKDDPVLLTRSRPADQINDIQFEYLNRGMWYNVETVEIKDQASIEAYGLRNTNTFSGHFICNPGMAAVSATLMLYRQYVRNTYEFTLGWQFILLDPMDIIAITDVALGLHNQWVRIISIEEDADGNLKFTAEDYINGTGNAPVYALQQSSRAAANYNADPGNVNAPVIFEVPGTLTGITDLEVWVGASGGALWGGADVWVSQDGTTYNKQGQITGPARYGVTTTALGAKPAGIGLDTVNSLGVNLTASGGALTGTTAADALAYNTLALVGSGIDAELLAYQTATLTGASQYTLTNLARDGYDTNGDGQASGVPFIRLDNALLQIPITNDRIGKPFYVKFVSFNIYGGGGQDISTVPAYTFTPMGISLSAPLPNVTNLVNAFVGGFTVLQWTQVTDPRTVDYEIRKGAVWATAVVLGRTSSLTIPAQGDDTYWVAAHAQPIPGLDVYSAEPVNVEITGATLVQNVIVAYDEEGAGWPGTITNLSASGSNLYLPATSTDGYYTIPTGHQVNIGRVAPVALNVIFSGRSQSTTDDVISYSDIFTAPADLLAAAPSNLVSIVAEIQTAGSGGVFGPWVQYQPGQYNAQYFNLRMHLKNLDPLQLVNAELISFSFTVDVPDRVDLGNAVAIAAGGTTITYAAPFNDSPNVQVTILGATAGDDVIVTAATAAGFTVQVLNGGSGVARTVNWVAQGY